MIYGKIFCIVEGRGEQKAAPAFIKKILRHHHHVYIADMEDGFFLPRGQILNNKIELNKAIRLGHLKISKSGTGRIIIMLDSDDDITDALYSRIRANINPATTSFLIDIIIFEKEYECMFILEQDGLKSHSRVRQNAEFSPNPCAIRDAKGWFQRKILHDGDTYSPAVDQLEFTKTLDVEPILLRLTCAKFLACLG